MERLPRGHVSHSEADRQSTGAGPSSSPAVAARNQRIAELKGTSASAEQTAGPGRVGFSVWVGHPLPFPPTWTTPQLLKAKAAFDRAVRQGKPIPLVMRHVHNDGRGGFLQPDKVEMKILEQPQRVQRVCKRPGRPRLVLTTEQVRALQNRYQKMSDGRLTEMINAREKPAKLYSVSTIRRRRLGL